MVFGLFFLMVWHPGLAKGEGKGMPPESPESMGQIEKGVGAPAVSPEFQERSTPSKVEALSLDENVRPKGESRVREGSEFRLKGIKVIGNETLSDEEITRTVKPYVGGGMTGKGLKEIAAKITQLFVKKGYATSRCIIPAQKVTDGVVVLQIEENRLGRILLGGKSAYRHDVRLFMRHFHDLVGKIIHIDTLNSRLQLLTKLPSTRIRPSLGKGVQGTSNLLLNITDYEDYYTVSVNNRGSRFTGENVTSFLGTLYNITGEGDWMSTAITTNPLHTEQIGSVSFSYVRPFGERGGKVRFGFSHFGYQLDNEKVGDDTLLYEGESSTFQMSYEEPFWLEKGDFWWSAGFEKKKSVAKTLANQFSDFYQAGETIVEGEDELFVGEFSVRASIADSLLNSHRAINSASFAVKHAFEGLFGSMTEEDVTWKRENQNDSNQEVEGLDNLQVANWSGPIGNIEGMEPAFWKYYLNFSRLQALPFQVIAKFNLDVELSPNKKVPSAYQFVGADNGVSGYSYNLLLSRPFLNHQLVPFIGYKETTAFSYYRNNNPGCGFKAIKEGLNQCQTSTPYVGVSSNYKKFFSDLTYQPSIDSFESNQNKFKINMGVRW